MKPCKILLLSAALFLIPFNVHATRIKDIASINGVRKNQIFGYGLVIGLAGTGDSYINIPFVIQSVVSLLSRMNIVIPPDEIDDIKVKNVATVMVTANLPPFAKIGNKIDVIVSSLGDAKSLKGGTLLFTPLNASDGKIYALAQGAISIGGGKGAAKSHLTAGKIPGGATIEKELQFSFKNKRYLTLSLRNPDFTTAFRMSKAINISFKKNIARADDAGNVRVKVPLKFRNKEISFIAAMEDISIIPDTIARVVIDERTGTVVVGSNVVISTVAISHGNLSVEIKKPKVAEVTASAAGIRRRRRAPAAGRGRNKDKGQKVLLVQGGTNIEELVNALNAIGVSSEDLITIFQSLKVSGALQAELEII